MGLSDVLGHLTTLCAAVDIPVNADFESGFASEPERLAENVRLAVATGVAGLSVEDRVVGEVARLYDASASVEGSAPHAGPSTGRARTSSWSRARKAC